MKFSSKNEKGYSIHVINTNKFKTVSIKIVFSGIAVKEEITLKNFLSDILTYSCKKYKKRNDVAVALQELYAMDVFSSCYRIGNLYNMEIGASFLNEKYTEKGMFEESIDLLKEIIFNPNVSSDRFDEYSFKYVQESIKNQIESVRENSRKLSLIKMLENMGKDEIYSCHGYGYVSDLEKITPENLYAYYKKVLRESKIDIFILGNIDENDTVKIIENKFNFNGIKEIKKNYSIEHKSIRKRIKKVIEKDNISQSKLSIGCKMVGMNDYEKNYVLPLYSIILGGGSDSKLFKEIREKNSLCYYVTSSANKLDNILFITSGISSCNFEKSLKLIKKCMNDMQSGNFLDDSINNAKMQYITMLNELFEDPFQIISTYYSICVLKYDDFETRLKKIHTVTYDDIKNISKKIFMDTVFLLKGDETVG